MFGSPIGLEAHQNSEIRVSASLENREALLQLQLQLDGNVIHLDHVCGAELEMVPILRNYEA